MEVMARKPRVANRRVVRWEVFMLLDFSMDGLSWMGAACTSALEAEGVKSSDGPFDRAACREEMLSVVATNTS